MIGFFYETQVILTGYFINKADFLAIDTDPNEWRQDSMVTKSEYQVIKTGV
jgi:hypothetical protein